MSIQDLAPEYLKTIESLKIKLDSLNQTLVTTYGLEAKRKIRNKIFGLESVLRQTILIYNHLNTYYDKEIRIHGFL